MTSYQELYKVHSFCGFCNRKLNKQRVMKLCDPCYEGIRTEVILLRRESNEALEDEERQLKDWRYKFQLVI